MDENDAKVVDQHNPTAGFSVNGADRLHDMRAGSGLMKKSGGRSDHLTSLKWQQAKLLELTGTLEKFWVRTLAHKFTRIHSQQTCDQ
jgi:hypothetical protein